MSEPSSSTATSRKCPECGRVVPPRELACRCGHDMQFADSDTDSGDKNVAGTVVALIMAFVAIGGALYWVRSHGEPPVSEIAIPVDDDPHGHGHHKPQPAAPETTIA